IFVFQLCKSLKTSQNELSYERQVRIEQLTSTAPFEYFSSLIVEGYQKQIDELRQKLSENNEERTLLRDRHNEIKRELTLTKYKEELISLVEERNELIEQPAISLIEHQHEIELKQSIDVENQTDEDIEVLHEQLNDLNDKNLTLLSQIESQHELKRQKLRNNSFGLEPVKSKIFQIQKPLIITINDIITARPDLFKDISEEIHDRLDSLISTIENQIKQIIKLQFEFDQTTDKY
ncbi:unnamed protein product, partial [Rotaria magnacalcarata]